MRLAAAIFRLCALMIMAAFIVLPAQAWAKSSINKDWRGLALQGYDMEKRYPRIHQKSG
jgi:hypothetical protein